MNAKPYRIHELAHRTDGGVEVALLWRDGTQEVAVTVADRRTGQTFRVPVRNDESALDVFHHPFAYAATRRVGILRAA